MFTCFQFSTCESSQPQKTNETCRKDRTVFEKREWLDRGSGTIHTLRLIATRTGNLRIEIEQLLTRVVLFKVIGQAGARDMLRQFNFDPELLSEHINLGPENTIVINTEPSWLDREVE